MPRNDALEEQPNFAGDWWRSLDELAKTPQFQEYLHREFPENATEWLGGSRREFLRLMTASLALAGLTGCRIKQPQEKIVPTVKQTGIPEPGLPLYFTTTMELAGQALGLTVQSSMGRPIKIEGNPNHPASVGATTVFAQAATLNLYDPDRLRAIRHRNSVVPRSDFFRELNALRDRFDAEQGQGLRILCDSTTSPTRARLLEEISRRWPKSKWFVYEPVNDDAQRQGLQWAFGKEQPSLTPVYDFSQARVILSIDADFLAARDFPPSYIRDFANARRIVGNDAQRADANATGGLPQMVRLYHLGTSPTVTAAKADHRLALAPHTISQLVREIAAQLDVVPNSDAGEYQDDQAERIRAFTRTLVSDLKAAGARGTVIVGREQPAAVHALAAAINDHLQAIGTTVQYHRCPQVRPAPQSLSDFGMLQQLTEEMQQRQVETLLILGGNAVYDAPADLQIAQAFKKVPLKMMLCDAGNETSQLCDWQIPESHFLETWGDHRTCAGIASLAQPLLSPLYESLSAIELLGSLLSDSATGFALVQETWKSHFKENFEEQWDSTLAKGVVADSAAKSVSVRVQTDLSQALSSPSSPESGWSVLFRPDPNLWDGRFANNGWLQELPRPLSTLVWDNAAWIAPADARELGVENGDLVNIEVGKESLSVPIWIMPGQARKCVMLFLGFGRKQAGRIGIEQGFDVYPLRTSRAASTVAAKVKKQGGHFHLVATQHHHLMDGRHIARAGTLEEYRQQPESPEFAHPPEHNPETSFYRDWKYEGYRWGMTIDLTACVGCSACVIACQAENNIPVVGKKQVDMNREMHWIRVDTYYQGNADDPEQILQQPVPCMHCEDAPCEVVCPVAATNHDNEGLNQMVYNRCVGTRYCSNNCPYKVRRFNFLSFSDEFITHPSLKLLSNPDVTLRSRGVMEKCTYCIQRIQQGRIAAQLQDRGIRDGDVQTACQTVCPAQAIRFGDLNDTGSAVRETRDHPLTYELLKELNTIPRTTYLAEVTNPARQQQTPSVSHPSG